jgi:hypothetical protein
MLLLLFPQGAAAGELDVANSLNDALYRLGFQGAADIAAAGSWVSVAELFQWADEAAKELAYRSGVFLTADASITAIAGTATYALPARHVFTVNAWLNGVPLRITAVRDLWALDANWPTTSGNTTRASMDAGSVGSITLYPNPLTGGPLAQVCQECPPAIALGASAILLPTVLVDYFTYAMLAGARGKESEAAMPEMASHFEQRLKLYESVIQHLWGAGQ